MSEPVDPSTQGHAPDPEVPLPPGAGSPLQPGPPMSVNAPISDTTINRSALLTGIVIAAVILVAVVVILVAILSRRPM